MSAITTTFADWTADMLSDADRARLTADLAEMLEGGHPTKGDLPDAGFAVYSKCDHMPYPNQHTVRRVWLSTAGGSWVATAYIMDRMPENVRAYFKSESLEGTC